MRGGGNTNRRRRDEGDCGSGDDDTGKDQEQRVAGLKKRFETIQSEVEATNGEIENAKRIIEVAEEELNGYEVELSLKEAMDEFGLGGSLFSWMNSVVFAYDVIFVCNNLRPTSNSPMFVRPELKKLQKMAYSLLMRWNA